MACIYPYQTKQGYHVPCGKCPKCLQSRTEQWVFRLQNELKHSISSHFVTFTYNEENIPTTPNRWKTLCTADLQKFFKRLRKVCPAKVSYYAVGEYGSTGQRPHYHAIIFNCTNPDFFQLLWADRRNGNDFGNVFIGDVTSNSCGYVAGYIQKKRVVPVHPTDDRRKEFSIMSKALGQPILLPK